MFQKHPMSCPLFQHCFNPVFFEILSLFRGFKKLFGYFFGKFINF